MPAPNTFTLPSITGPRRLELILLFGLLTCFTPIAIDMYLPAMPTIAREFGSPIAAIEHSLASYFLGIAIGQAMVGPLSDRFGRRWPIILGLGLYVIGSTGCALAQGPLMLDFARFVQALGGCAGTVLARACVRDLFPPAQAGRIFAQMLMILSVSPLFAPFVGGWLLPITGWRSLFWIQGAAATATMVLVIWQLPESHPGSDRRLHPFHVLMDYWDIARDRNFYGNIVPAVLTGAGLYVFLTGWAHLVIGIFHVPPQYFGFTFVLNGVGLIAASWGTSRWLKHRPGPPLLLAGIIVNAVVGVAALLLGWVGWGGLLALVPCMFVYCSLMGSINPTSTGLMIHHFGHTAGMASALAGIFMYGAAFIASMIMGAFPSPTTAVPMTGLMCVFGLSGIVTYLLFRPRAAG